MEQRNYYQAQEKSFQAVAAVDSRDQGLSMLIGAVMVFGLAAGGLAIGYVTPFVQWLFTGILSSLGALFAISGIVKVMAGR